MLDRQHNNPPDPIDEALAPFGDFISEAENWLDGTAVENESPLRSFRRDGQNLIATTDPRFFFAEVAIAHAAKLVAVDKFNMAEREERIRFHSEVREQVLARLARAF